MMTDALSILGCPVCMGLLNLEAGDRCACSACGRDYPLTLGIPDLRLPEFIGDGQREAKIAARLAAEYPNSDHIGLVKTYFHEEDNSQVPDHLVSFYQDHWINQVERGVQFAEMFLRRLSPYYSLPNRGIACEVGCGTGAGLLALAERFDWVIGIDPDLPSLIVAKKLMEQNHFKNFLLLQAVGQKLPLQPNSLAYVTAQNTLEHVFEIERVMLEFARVLGQGGCFAADSRNRYDLFFPEPHVKVRWVGLLPRRWADAYVRWRIGMDYSAVHTRLLSFGELRLALQKAFYKNWKILYPEVSVYGGSKKIDQLVGAWSKIPGLAQAGLFIFPSHLAIAQKQFNLKPS